MDRQSSFDVLSFVGFSFDREPDAIAPCPDGVLLVGLLSEAKITRFGTAYCRRCMRCAIKGAITRHYAVGAGSNSLD